MIKDRFLNMNSNYWW